MQTRNDVTTATSFNALTGAATQVEQEAGSSTTTAVTPGRQQYHPSACKAWAQIIYSGGVPTSTIKYNVTSLTDSATGDGIANLTVAFSSANFGTLGSNNTTAAAAGVYTKSTGASTLRWVTNNLLSAATDYDITIAAFGDQ